MLNRFGVFQGTEEIQAHWIQEIITWFYHGDGKNLVGLIDMRLQIHKQVSLRDLVSAFFFSCVIAASLFSACVRAFNTLA